MVVCTAVNPLFTFIIDFLFLPKIYLIMKTFRKLVAASIVSSAVFLAIATAAYASGSGECTPVYGGGVVCPTPTPPPNLPSAGVEEFVIPGFLSVLTGGLYLSRKAIRNGKRS